MQLFKMPPNKPSCFLYAAAMVLDITPNKLAEEIGHDGLQVVNPNLNAPHCYRGVHSEEVLESFLKRGFGLMEISYYPILKSCLKGIEVEIFTPKEADKRFKSILKYRNAIIITVHNDIRHAVAWNGVQCYDPKGRIGKLDDYLIESAFVIVRL